MSDAVELTLRLNDQVSNAALRAAGSLKKAESQAKKTQQALGFGKDIGRSLDKLNKLKLDPGGFKELQRLNKEISEQKKKLSGGFFSGLGKGLFGWAGPQGAARLWSNVAGAVIADSIVGGARAAADLFADGVRKAFSYGADYEKLNLSYELLLGKKGATEANADVTRFAGKTAYDDDEIRQIMRPLFLAGMSVNQGRAAFAASADLAAAGANIDEVAQAFAKIQQGGGIRKLQLQSFGVNVPTLYQALGKKMGISSKDVEQRASEVYGGPGSGRGIDPQILLNAIYDTIEKRQGGMLGTGAERAGQTMAAQWHKLTMLPQQYIREISKSQGWTQLSNKLGDVFKQLDPRGAQGQAIIGSLLSAFNEVAGSITDFLTPQSIDAFAASLRGAVGTAKDMLVIFRDISSVALEVVKYIDRMIRGYQEFKSDLDYAKKGGEAAAGSNKATFAQRMGARFDVLDQMMGPDKDLLDRKKQELEAGLRTHSLMPVEIRQRQSEIAMLERRMHMNDAVPMLPRVASQKSSAVLVAQSVNIHPAPNDTEHTRQSITTVTADGAQRGAERALQGMSGK